MHRSPLVVLILYVSWLVCQQCCAFAVTRANKDYRGSGEVSTSKDVATEAINAEPSCEELKAMWRFSKRQSRAAEITNEIPTYRDPFTYNLWEPTYFARSRSIGGMRMGNKYRGRPIYGRVVHKAPVLRIQDVAERNRAFEEVARMYGTVQRATEPRRRATAFRLPGGGHMSTMGLTPQSGSFQHLKELIRTERARELQEQRMAEEVAARATALKELSVGSGHRNQASSLHDMSYVYDTDGRDDRESMVNEGVLAFPDLLAPAAAARIVNDDVRYLSDYSFSRDSPRHHSSSLFDASTFNNDFDGYML